MLDRNNKITKSTARLAGKKHCMVPVCKSGVVQPNPTVNSNSFGAEKKTSADEKIEEGCQAQERKSQSRIPQCRLRICVILISLLMGRPVELSQWDKFYLSFFVILELSAFAKSLWNWWVVNYASATLLCGWVMLTCRPQQMWETREIIVINNILPSS